MAVLVVAVTFGGAFLGLGTAVAAAFTWSQASEITPPANAARFPGANFRSLACAASGSCVAVGRYFGYAPEYGPYPMAANETGGVWGPASGAVMLPPNAASNQGFSLRSVACSASGSCFVVGSYTALGHYTNSEHQLVPRLDVQAMVVPEVGGVWGQASEVTLPANAANDTGPETDSNPQAYFQSTACAASGPCAAVGYYTDSSGHSDAMVLTEAGGVWGQASEVTPPANAASPQQPSVVSVACPASESCVAIGAYFDASGYRHAMVVSETSGVWGQASEVTPPANAAIHPQPNLESVGCAASGPCAAVGYYTDSSGRSDAMVVTEAGGVWGQASEVTPPANAASNPEAGLRSVGCAASGSCVAVGHYTDSSGNGQPMVVNETTGVWGHASEVTLPANAASTPASSQEPYLVSVACPDSGSCAAIGDYFDGSGHRHAMVVNETAGVWGQASEVTPPANAANSPGAYLSSLACPALGSCVAVGWYDEISERERRNEQRIEEQPIEQAMVVSEGTSGQGSTVSGSTTAEGSTTAPLTGASATTSPPGATATTSRPPTTTAGTGGVTLSSANIIVHSNGEAAVKLACRGTATCRGKLTLAVNSTLTGDTKKHSRMETIGTSTFSIPAGTAATIKLEIRSLRRALFGRTLLRGHRRRLRASLTILKSSPLPAKTQHVNVFLVR